MVVLLNVPAAGHFDTSCRAVAAAVSRYKPRFSSPRHVDARVTGY
jgi:hypothetical protein